MNLRTATTETLLAFTATLSTPDWRKLDKYDIAKIDLFIKSDGCTGVPDFYRDCCVIHDWWYRTHRNFDGTLISKDEADRGLQQCIRSKSWLGRFSPMALWRYYGVKEFGKKAWD